MQMFWPGLPILLAFAWAILVFESQAESVCFSCHDGVCGLCADAVRSCILDSISTLLAAAIFLITEESLLEADTVTLETLCVGACTLFLGSFECCRLEPKHHDFLPVGSNDRLSSFWAR
jgi:hypothetical protein